MVLSIHELTLVFGTIHLSFHSYSIEFALIPITFQFCTLGKSQRAKAIVQLISPLARIVITIRPFMRKFTGSPALIIDDHLSLAFCFLVNCFSIVPIVTLEISMVKMLAIVRESSSMNNFTSTPTTLKELEAFAKKNAATIRQ